MSNEVNHSGAEDAGKGTLPARPAVVSASPWLI